MVESKPVNIGLVAHVLGMNSKKLHRWYKEVLSGFTQAQKDGTLKQHNLWVIEQGRVKEIPVPIFEQKNLGLQTAIDDEILNRNLQPFINTNYGASNVNFFLFLTKIYFT